MVAAQCPLKHGRGLLKQAAGLAGTPKVLIEQRQIVERRSRFGVAAAYQVFPDAARAQQMLLGLLELALLPVVLPEIIQDGRKRPPVRHFGGFVERERTMEEALGFGELQPGGVGGCQVAEGNGPIRLTTFGFLQKRQRPEKRLLGFRGPVRGLVDDSETAP